jgi:hypothetical protein
MSDVSRDHGTRGARKAFAIRKKRRPFARVGAAQAATSVWRSCGASSINNRIKIKPKASATKAAGYFLLS